MKFAVTYAVLVVLVGTRLLSHMSSPGLLSAVTVPVASCLVAAPPVAIWWAVDRRRRLP